MEFVSTVEYPLVKNPLNNDKVEWDTKTTIIHFTWEKLYSPFFFCGLKFQSHGKKLKSPEKPPQTCGFRHLRKERKWELSLADMEMLWRQWQKKEPRLKKGMKHEWNWAKMESSLQKGKQMKSNESREKE